MIICTNKPRLPVGSRCETHGTSNSRDRQPFAWSIWWQPAFLALILAPAMCVAGYCQHIRAFYWVAAFCLIVAVTMVRVNWQIQREES